MQDALRIANSVQNLLVWLSAALLLIALWPSDPAPFKSALNDVIVLGKDGAAELSDFVTDKWLVEPRRDDEILPIHAASNETLVTFGSVLRESMKTLGVGINDEAVFRSFDPQFVRLEGWERPDLFLPLPPVERPTIRRMLDYLEQDSLAGVILVLPSYEIWLSPHIARAAQQERVSLGGTRLVGVRLVSDQIGKGRIDAFGRRPGVETPRGLFRFSFERGTRSSQPLIHLNVDVPMNRTGFRVEEDEWLELQRSWYASRGLDSDCYVPAQDSYLNLRRFESEIWHMTIEEASVWLQDRLREEDLAVSLWGVSVGRSLVAMVGPLVLSVLMLNLIVTMKHIAVVSGTAPPVHTEPYWAVLSPSRMTRNAGILSVSFVPGLTCIVLAVCLGSTAAIRLLNVVGVLLAICVFSNAVSLAPRLLPPKGGRKESHGTPAVRGSETPGQEESGV